MKKAFFSMILVLSATSNVMAMGSTGAKPDAKGDTTCSDGYHYLVSEAKCTPLNRVDISSMTTADEVQKFIVEAKRESANYIDSDYIYSNIRLAKWNTRIKDAEARLKEIKDVSKDVSAALNKPQSLEESTRNKTISTSKAR